jgi:uncharacterized Zn-binding protein involved in type VI secretion
MPQAHRDGDKRACGASTIVTNQFTTFVNKKLWAVEGDQDSHGGGGLIPTKKTVFIQGKPVITHFPDKAGADSLCPVEGGAHWSPDTAFGSKETFAYGGVVTDLPPDETQTFGGYELREDLAFELREDGSFELREGDDPISPPFTPSPTGKQLREEEAISIELREDGSISLREDWEP